MSHDTLLHRSLRPAVSRLVGTRVTPDVLTSLRMATGLAAAACMAVGSGWQAIGAGLFLVSTLLDRADGELARQSARFSAIGPNFDLVSDCISTMAIFIGLGIGAAAGLPAALALYPPAGLLLGVVAAISTASLFALLNMLPDADGGPAGAVLPSRRFDPDDMMLAVPLAIWCGGASWVLLAAGVLTPLAATAVAVLRLRRPAARPLGQQTMS